MKRNLLLYIFLLLSTSAVFAQERVRQRNDPNVSNRPDTTQPASVRSDTARIDTAVGRRGDIDTIVTYSARDTAVYDLKARHLHLRGDAKVSFKDQKLEAEIIDLYFDRSILSAEAGRDSMGNLVGVPRFNDAGEEFSGERLTYSFKTRRGTIALGETRMGEGFYFGSKINRVSENTLFVENGAYTTCNLPHPHYFFAAPEMKVVVNDKIYADPLMLFVEDVPIFALPIGLFFENKSGRRSGLVIPQYFFSRNQGVVFNGLGYYFALSDYYDTQILLNLTSRGSFVGNNIWRYNVRNSMSGSVDLSYGRWRDNIETEYTTQYRVAVQHNQQFTPQSQLNANVNFMSNDYNRRVSTNIYERIQQRINSNAGYSQSFDNGSNLSASFSRSQSLVDGTFEQTLPALTYQLPQLFPFQRFTDMPDWVRDINLRWTSSGEYNFARQIITQPDNPDTSYRDFYSTFIDHRPSISISPKLGFFSIQPSINLAMRWYPRRLTRSADPVTNQVTDSYEHGFFQEYYYSLGVGVQTRLYGVLQPNILGLNAIRHTLQPSISFNYTPGFGEKFWGTYTDTNDREITYSRFEADRGGISPRNLVQGLNYRLDNSLEAKLSRRDTSGTETKIELLRFGISGGYNFTADSLRFSPVSLDFRTPSTSFLNFNGTATFNLYDQRKNITGNPSQVQQYEVVNRLLLFEGKGLARLTDIRLNLSLSFSSQGLQLPQFSLPSDTNSTRGDSASPGLRFRRADTILDPRTDFFAENSPGYSPFNIPWNLAFNISYSNNRPTPDFYNENLTLTANGSFTLTPTWAFNTNFGYDFKARALTAPSLNVRKDLHCWELNFQWIPIGYSQGFYLRFGIKASQLSESLKLERRNNAVYQ